MHCYRHTEIKGNKTMQVLDKLGYYLTMNGTVVKIVYIGLKPIDYNFQWSVGDVIAVNELSNELLFYNKNGEFIEGDMELNLIQYLGEKPILYVKTEGYYKCRNGSIVRVIHICDKESLEQPVFVIDEGTSKYYTVSIYGKNSKFPDLDLIEFISK
jgi:hypothetical protein